MLAGGDRMGDWDDGRGDVVHVGLPPGVVVGVEVKLTRFRRLYSHYLHVPAQVDRLHHCTRDSRLGQRQGLAGEVRFNLGRVLGHLLGPGGHPAHVAVFQLEFHRAYGLLGPGVGGGVLGMGVGQAGPDHGQ